MVSWRPYTNRELRSVLSGLGYSVPQNDLPLTDAIAEQSVRAFQFDHNLPTDGIAGEKTQEIMATIVSGIQKDLNLLIQPNPSLPGNQFYGPKTTEAIKTFQMRYQLPITGIADTYVCQRLSLATQNLQPNPLPLPTQPRYTPIQLRAVLEGLGYATIAEFQQDYSLTAHGQADSQTQELAATTVRNLQHNLNLIFKPYPLIPYSELYDAQTEAYVRKFQQEIGLPATGIADLRLRSRLDKWAKNQWVLQRR